jgi:AraC-like DNA-binding protein
VSLQANIFLLLFGAIQGFLLSIALLRKRERHPSHIFLTLFLVVVGLQLTFKVITKVWLMQHAWWFYVWSYNLPFLAAPAIYLFMRSAATGASFSKKDLLHAIPFVLGSFIYLEWMKAGAQLISLIIYYWHSYRLIQSSKGLRQFLNYVTIAETIIVITLALSVIYYNRIPDLRMLFVSLTIVIYWITWKITTDPNALLATVVNRYAHSGLKDEEAARIETELRNLMQTRKIFTDSKLTVDKLAGLLGTSRHHLSQVLNHRVRQSYFDYISGLRLEEARRRLCDQASARYTIAAIALDSGFSSVSTFNDAFKRKYGVTPSGFRKSLTD